jgi:hypothetical protein
MEAIVDRIKERNDLSLYNETMVYKLNASTYKDVKGTPVFINAVGLWRYGKTNDSIGGKDTYSELGNKIIRGVRGVPLYKGTEAAMLVMEKLMIYVCYFAFKELPSGNLIFR